MQAFILIGLGGAFGAISRYGVGIIAQRSLGNHFAYGTLLVNLLGCLLLGILMEIQSNTNLVPHPMRLLFAVGFLGAFTTFSTFGYETMTYLKDGAGSLAMINISANLILGCGAIWVGWVVARGFFPAA